VLCADASEASARARAYAVGLARRQGARLVAVHAQRRWAAMGAGCETLPPEFWAVHARDVLQLVEVDLAAADARPGRQIEVRARTGRPGPQLLAMATELRADAVIIGAPRRAVWRGGSVAGCLLRAKRFPVIVVP